MNSLLPESLSLRRLCRRPPLKLGPDVTVREAMIQLNRLAMQAGVVMREGIPLGMVTLSSLVDGLTLQGGSLDDPAIFFMTAALITLPADAPVHRARVLMTRSRLGYLFLTEADGSFCNLLAKADIPGFREDGTNRFLHEVESAVSLEKVAEISGEIRQCGADLFFGGIGVEPLCQWISCLNDLVVMRIIELVATEFELPPVAWSWMVFGSEGRLEQTFTTDQDNGLIFQPDRLADTEKIRQVFLPFCRAVNQALDDCGFVLCPGKIMASNPDWCLSLQEWQERFAIWMKTPEPEALLGATIFFDFRALYGQDELVDELRNWLLPRPARYPRFLYGLAEQALGCSPALSFLNTLVCDGPKEAPHTIDFKMHGSRPFIDAARIWALQYGIWETSTLDRLRSAAVHQGRSHGDTASTVEAFEFIQRLRIQQQLRCTRQGRENLVDPNDLNALEKMMLKEALKQAKVLQLRLRQESRL